MSDWRNKCFYKASKNDICCVCDSNVEIGIEPRFGYCICQEHSDIPPAKLDEAKAKWQNEHK